jgi:hypothetical protein
VPTEPFIPGDRTPRRIGTLGVIGCKVFTGESEIAAFEQARFEARQMREPSERTRRPPSIDERLRRLGIRPRRAR